MTHTETIASRNGRVPNADCGAGAGGKPIFLIDPFEMTGECFRRMLAVHFRDVRAFARAPSDGAADLVLLYIGFGRTDAPEFCAQIADLRAKFGRGTALAVIAERDDATLAMAAIRLG